MQCGGKEETYENGGGRFESLVVVVEIFFLFSFAVLIFLFSKHEFIEAGIYFLVVPVTSSA